MRLTLLHEWSNSEPKTVQDGELILDNLGFGLARMWILPLVRRETSQNKQHKTHNFKNEKISNKQNKTLTLSFFFQVTQVSGNHVQPDVDREWRQKWEQVGRILNRSLEQNANAKIEKRNGKIDDLFALKVDRETSYGQVCFLKKKN